MGYQDIIDRLERAESEILTAENQLNDSAHKCGHCGLTIRHDFTETQMKESLQGIRTKLRRYAGSLRAKLAQDPLPNRT